MSNPLKQGFYKYLKMCHCLCRKYHVVSNPLNIRVYNDVVFIKIVTKSNFCVIKSGWQGMGLTHCRLLPTTSASPMEWEAATHAQLHRTYIRYIIYILYIMLMLCFNLEQSVHHDNLSILLIWCRFLIQTEA